jgi:ABC-type antimicrobial peptide transport system permease subunit
MNRLSSLFLLGKEKISKNDIDDTNTTTTAIDEDVESIYFKRNHQAYLNSFGNCFDAVSIISYWADVVLMIFEYPYLSLFKSMGALRPVRLLSVLPGTAVILKSLETSWDIILAVTGLILFFLLLFALIGLISFRGVFSRRCYFTDNDNSRKAFYIFNIMT